MCALTLPVSAALARSMLQLSLSQSGYTPVTKAMRSPLGDQTGPPAPPLTFEILCSFAPLAPAIQSWPAAMYAIRLPSGDHLASVAPVFAFGNWRAIPPLAGCTLVTVVRLLALTSVVRTEYNTQRPSEDTCGSPTFLTATKSSNVIGRCTRPCAERSTARSPAAASSSPVLILMLACRSSYCGCSTAAMSTSILTSSPTIELPSTMRFQVMLKSLRLIVASASKPARRLPGAPVMPLRWPRSTTGCVMPCIVRFPATVTESPAKRETFVLLNVTVGLASASKWLSLRRSASRRSLFVSMLDVCETTSTEAVFQSAGSAMIVPLHASNWPRTLLTMCRIVNESSECVGSIFHVDGALTEVPALDDCAGRALCAPARAGARARSIESLRII